MDGERDDSSRRTNLRLGRPSRGNLAGLGGIEPLALHDRHTMLDLLDTAPDPEELTAFFGRPLVPLTN